MSRTLWSMILITGIFIGFMMGYSVPPMVEVGMIGGGVDAKVGLKSDLEQDVEEYYRGLSVQDSDGQ